MQLSILITAHNRLGTLEQCIESINRNSKYQHEIIICGDRIDRLLVDKYYLPYCFYTPRDYAGPIDKVERDLEMLDKSVADSRYTILKHFSMHEPPDNVKIVCPTEGIPTHILLDGRSVVVDPGSHIYATCEGLKIASNDWRLIMVDSECYFPPGWDDDLDQLLKGKENMGASFRALRAAFIENGQLNTSIGEYYSRYVREGDYKTWNSLMYVPVPYTPGRAYQLVNPDDINKYSKQRSMDYIDFESFGHRQQGGTRCVLVHRNYSQKHVESFRDEMIKPIVEDLKKGVRPYTNSFCLMLDNWFYKFGLQKACLRKFIYIGSKDSYLDYNINGV